MATQPKEQFGIGTRLVQKGHFELLAMDVDAAKFRGYAAVYGLVPYAYGPRGGTYLQPGSFDKTIKEAQAANKQFKVLWNHDIDIPIGLATVLTDSRGLPFEAMVNNERDPITNEYLHQKAMEVFSNIRMTIIDEMSIGFEVMKYTFDEEKEARYITEAKLWEISPVTFPANPAARIAEIYSAVMKAMPENERNLLLNADKIVGNEILITHTTSLPEEPGGTEPRKLLPSTPIEAEQQMWRDIEPGLWNTLSAIHDKLRNFNFQLRGQ